MAINPTAGTLTSLTSSSLGTLASANYCVSSSYNCTTNKPVDVIVETVVATTNTPSGNKQVLVFAQASFDAASTWQTGPTSGSTTTDEPLLTYLGTIQLQTASTTERKAFSVFNAYGFLPPMFRVIHKNDLGVALTTGTVATVEITVP